MDTKLGLGGKGQEKYSKKTGQYSTELQKKIEEVKNRSDSDLRLKKYVSVMSEKEKESHKLDQFIYTPFFEQNGLKVLKQILKEKSPNSEVFDIYELFSPEKAEEYDLSGVDYAIKYKNEFYAVDLKTFVPNKNGINNVLKLPLITFDQKRGKYVEGWFIKEPKEINLNVNGKIVKTKSVLTDLWIFQNISKDLTNINTSIVNKEKFKKFIFKNFFSEDFNQQELFNSFKAMFNNKKMFEKKPEKLGNFILTYNKNDEVCQMVKILKTPKGGFPISLVFNIYYDKNNNPTFSMQLQPPIKLLKYFNGCQNLNGNEENENIIIDKLFNIKR